MKKIATWYNGLTDVRYINGELQDWSERRQEWFKSCDQLGARNDYYDAVTRGDVKHQSE